MTFEILADYHIEASASLALNEYKLEQNSVNILPNSNLDDFSVMLSKLIKNKLGVVALNENKVVGFMSCYDPWENHFGNALGTFSPMFAHGADNLNKSRIYTLLYQKASEVWVNQGILSHAIGLCAHSNETISSFFENGFGLRCIDSIRPVEEILLDEDVSKYEFKEVNSNDELKNIIPLRNNLDLHLQSSPVFMPMDAINLEQFTESVIKNKSHLFVAIDNEKTIGYLEFTPFGDSFVYKNSQMININGAYILPEYRGNGVFPHLLSFAMGKLKKHNFIRCGVDFESINPPARHCYAKYFTPYLYGVTRRIDERICKF